MASSGAAGDSDDEENSHQFSAAAFAAARSWVQQRLHGPFRLSHAQPLPSDLLMAVMVRCHW